MFVGADIEELDRLAKAFDDAAMKLEQMTRSLQRLANGSSWAGRDAEAFRSDWNGKARGALQRSSTDLRQAAQAVRRNADDQRTASGGGGVSLPGSPVSSGYKPTVISSEKRTLSLEASMILGIKGEAVLLTETLSDGTTRVTIEGTRSESLGIDLAQLLSSGKSEGSPLLNLGLKVGTEGDGMRVSLLADDPDSAKRLADALSGNPLALASLRDDPGIRPESLTFIRPSASVDADGAWVVDGVGAHDGQKFETSYNFVDGSVTDRIVRDLSLQQGTRDQSVRSETYSAEIVRNLATGEVQSAEVSVASENSVDTRSSGEQYTDLILSGVPGLQYSHSELATTSATTTYSFDAQALAQTPQIAEYARDGDLKALLENGRQYSSHAAVSTERFSGESTAGGAYGVESSTETSRVSDR